MNPVRFRATFKRISDLKPGSAFIDYKNQFKTAESNDEHSDNDKPKPRSSTRGSTSKISKSTNNGKKKTDSGKKSVKSTKGKGKKRTKGVSLKDVKLNDEVKWYTKYGRRVMVYNGKTVKGKKAYAIYKKYKELKDKQLNDVFDSESEQSEVDLDYVPSDTDSKRNDKKPKKQNIGASSRNTARKDGLRKSSRIAKRMNKQEKREELSKSNDSIPISLDSSSEEEKPAISNSFVLDSASSRVRKKAENSKKRKVLDEIASEGDCEPKLKKKKEKEDLKLLELDLKDDIVEDWTDSSEDETPKIVVLKRQSKRKDKSKKQGLEKVVQKDKKPPSLVLDISSNEDVGDNGINSSIGSVDISVSSLDEPKDTPSQNSIEKCLKKTSKVKLTPKPLQKETYKKIKPQTQNTKALEGNLKLIKPIQRIRPPSTAKYIPKKNEDDIDNQGDILVGENVLDMEQSIWSETMNGYQL